MVNQTIIQQSAIYYDPVGDILYFWDALTNSWKRLSLVMGYVTTQDLTDGLALKLNLTGGGITGDLTISGKLGVGGATPDTTNPVSMNTKSMLLNGSVDNMNVTLSKHAAANNAQITLQDNFSTRAIIGLLADDNVTVKVSANGSSFTTAMVIDKTTGHIGIGATPDSTNALSIGGSTVLCSSSAGSFGFVFSKHATANDASLTFQDNFSSRALIGLLGDDNFTFKVTPDGSTYYTGFTVTAANGKVDHTLGAKFEAYCNYKAYIAANTWTKIPLNSTYHNDQNAYSTANQRFVANVDGYYLITYKWRFEAQNTVPTSLLSRLAKGGTTIANTEVSTDGTVVSLKTCLQYSTVMKLSASEYVEVFVYMTGYDGNVELGSTSFAGARIA